MGYIRSNPDWYENQGMSPSEAERQVKKDKMTESIDYGFCNPIKAKFASEEEDEIERSISGKKQS